MSDANAQDLTGVWDGLFSYPRSYRPTTFTAVLMDLVGSLSGTVHELNNNGPTAGQMLEAVIDGRRDGVNVRFIKTYPPDTRAHGRPVRYEGVVASDGLQIEGVWSIAGSWSGKFLMTRSGGAQAEVEVETEARELLPVD